MTNGNEGDTYQPREVKASKLFEQLFGKEVAKQLESVRGQLAQYETYVINGDIPLVEVLEYLSASGEMDALLEITKATGKTLANIQEKKRSEYYSAFAEAKAESKYIGLVNALNEFIAGIDAIQSSPIFHNMIRSTWFELQRTHMVNTANQIVHIKKAPNISVALVRMLDGSYGTIPREGGLDEYTLKEILLDQGLSDVMRDIDDENKAELAQGYESEAKTYGQLFFEAGVDFENVSTNVEIDDPAIRSVNFMSTEPFNEMQPIALQVKFIVRGIEIEHVYFFSPALQSLSLGEAPFTNPEDVHTSPNARLRFAKLQRDILFLAVEGISRGFIPLKEKVITPKVNEVAEIVLSPEEIDVEEIYERLEEAAEIAVADSTIDNVTPAEKPARLPSFIAHFDAVQKLGRLGIEVGSGGRHTKLHYTKADGSSTSYPFPNSHSGEGEKNVRKFVKKTLAHFGISVAEYNNV